MWRVLLLVASGCDLIFDIEELPEPPAGVDHDLDGVFETDNCPRIANPDQIDDDTDGVGNECDPHPGEYDVVVAMTWTPLGAWTMTGDAWLSPDPSGGGSLVGESRELYRPALQVGFTMEAFDSTLLLKQLELHFDALTATGDCVIRYDPSVTSLSQIVMHVGGQPLASKRVTPDYELGQRYIATYSRALTSACTNAGHLLTRADVIERLTTTPTIALLRMQATIDHVTLYEVGP